MRLQVSMNQGAIAARGAAIAAALALSFAAPAWAQSRPREANPVPDGGMVGVGVSTGFAMPNSPDLNMGWGVGANVEGYFSPRISARGQFSGAWADIFGHTFTGTVKPMAADANIVYNWEGGVIHPYATGGVGLYRYRFDESTLSSADNHFGVDVGGGVEYFMNRRDTVTGEVLYHAVNGQAQGQLATYQPSYWSVSFGFKKYFGGR
jgi:hypothetical protein